jgi:hypothetical protein
MRVETLQLEILLVRRIQERMQRHWRGIVVVIENTSHHRSREGGVELSMYDERVSDSITIFPCGKIHPLIRLVIQVLKFSSSADTLVGALDPQGVLRMPRARGQREFSCAFGAKIGDREAGKNVPECFCK